MAKVYDAPIPAPEWEEYEVDGEPFNWKKMDEVDNAYIERLAEAARAQDSGKLVGEVVRFPHADGYAVYMVWNHRPLTLVHLRLHDAYAIPEAHERGLNLADIRLMVEREKGMAELFGRRSA